MQLLCTISLSFKLALYCKDSAIFTIFFYFIGGECDERVSNSVSLKSKLATSYEPEVIKDILYDLHEISEQSHAKVYFAFLSFISQVFSGV